jgi:flagellar basal-body rod protein FlgF
MGREMYPALSGGLRSMRSLDVLANNLANVNTTGFKADRVRFELTSAANGQPSGSADSRLGEAFVTTSTEVTDYSQGMLRETGNPTDFALQGESGFFRLEAQGDGGPLLSRAGAFHVDPEGFLAARGGERVLDPAGKPIAIPKAGPIEVDHQGGIRVGGTSVGRLAVVDVADRAALAKVGGGRWEAPPDAELVPTAAEVVQGHLESSNVEPVQALTELIAITRYFEAFQKNLDASSKLDEALNSQVGRLDR